MKELINWLGKLTPTDIIFIGSVAAALLAVIALGRQIIQFIKWIIHILVSTISYIFSIFFNIGY